MITSIPDKLYKLFILISIVAIGYIYISNTESEKVHFAKIDKFDNYLLEKEILEYDIEIIKEKLVTKAYNYSIKHDRDSIIKYNKDKSLIYTYPIIGDKKLLADIEKLNNDWEIYNQKIDELNKLYFKVKNYSDYLNNETKNYKIEIENRAFINIIAGIFLALGILMWGYDNIISDNDKPHSIQIENFYKKIKDRIYTYCQSCGKLFSASRNYGTEKDGSDSNCYCFECYQKGEFTNSELTKEEFIKNFKEENKQMNIIEKWALIKKLKNLDRWNPNKYF